MLSRAIEKAQAALLILRNGGPGPFLDHLRCQFYDRATFLALERYLDEYIEPVNCAVDYYIRVASDADMEQVGAVAKNEGRESAWELIGRKWYYESGFRDCYIARETGTDKPCFLQYMVPLSQYKFIDPSFSHRLPPLKEDEVWLENSYTFKEFRGKRVMSSFLVDLGDIAKKQGMRRMVTYIREDNAPSIKGCQRAGFKVYGRVPERKLLFSTTRDYSQA